MQHSSSLVRVLHSVSEYSVAGSTAVVAVVHRPFFLLEKQ
jgi:hypothetical protein